MSNIRLSKKHGVNPTLGVCFFCGEDSGEIALLGKLKGDVEAPRRMVLNYNPCDKCKEHMSQGVTLIECTTSNPNNLPAISKTEVDTPVHPTGRWSVIKKEAAERLFGGTEFSTVDILCLEDVVYHSIVDSAPKDTEETV